MIGNGFDLHFDLNTNPKDFEEYLETKSIYNESDNALNYFRCYGVDWSEYEQPMANIEFEELEEVHEQAPDYMSDYERDRDGVILDMEMLFDSLSGAINDALTDMVDAANAQIERYIINDSKYPLRLFNADDAILSFNYTRTVERLFDVPVEVPILHIHGFRDNEDPLVFGYRLDDKMIYPSHWELNEENGDYYIDQQRQIAYNFYTHLEKQLKIDKLNDFMNGLNVCEVIVLGHSMGIVDFDYMEEIEKGLNPKRWLISYYKDHEKNDILNRGYSFASKIQFCAIDEILS